MRACGAFTNHETTAQSKRRYVDRKLLQQRSSHSFEQRTKKRKISCMLLRALWAHLSQKFCLLSPDLAHLYLTPSTFANSTFFVRSHHTKKYHPPGLIRKRCKTRIPSPTSARIPLASSLSFCFLRQTDRQMFSSGQTALKEGDLHAPRNIQGTQACGNAITWTAGECFAVIFYA